LEEWIMPVQNPNDAAAPTPSDAAVVTAAKSIESQNAAGAYAALKKDYETHSQAFIAAERQRIQQDDPALLPRLSLEFARTLTQNDNLSGKDLSEIVGIGAANSNTNTALGADARLAGDMAQEIQPKLGALTSDNLWYHQNILTGSDIDRAVTDYDNTRQDSDITNALLGKDKGGTTLLQKIAGVNDLTPDMLQTALDRDNTEHFMTQDQHTALAALKKNWDDDSAQPLFGDDGTISAKSLGDFATKNNLHPPDASQPAAAAPADAAAPVVAPAAAAAPPPKETPIAVKAGMGDWDVAAQAMGLDDGTGTLEHQRAQIRAKLKKNPDALQPLLTLMHQLAAEHPTLKTTDSFNFTGSGNDVKLVPPPPTNPTNPTNPS
jgi:hypothetical protein